MNYTQPPASSPSLTYNIKQTTLNLSAADFTKLNTSPVQILPTSTGKIICPIQLTIQYDSRSILPNDTIYIGYESLLNVNLGTALMNLSLFSMSNQEGAFTFTTRFYNNDYSDTSFTQPLIFWMLIDDINTIFAKFYATITYIEIPKFI